ncbi:MAG: UDP-N-acetylglucosamine 2-epimerase (non-hydrolyzing), partial [Candidatus Jordarchaeales archaeon]
FAPTEKAKQILLGEGVADEKIFVTGNTIVDAVFQNLEIAKRSRNVLNDLGLNGVDYFLVTVHRQENVDDERRFRSILMGLELVRDKFDADLIYPIHPRSRRRLEDFGLRANGVRLIEPLDYLSFLQLESKARLVLTDSGGVQEEACILGVPCVTLRDNTERPETLDVGSNVLAGTDPHEIVNKVDFMLNKARRWSNPFGDGKAGARIVEILRWKLG